MIEFNPYLHEYKDNGRIIPSVTQILNGVGLIDFSGIPSRVLDIAKERGTTVHLITELLDRDELDESTIDPDLIGYVDAYRKFVEEYHIAKITAIEKLVYSDAKHLGYAGTLDRKAVLSTGLKLLYDIKTTAEKSQVHALQVTAYELADGEKMDQLGCVYLAADGKYEFQPYDRCVSGWLAALQLYKWKKNNHLI